MSAYTSIPLSVSLRAARQQVSSPFATESGRPDAYSAVSTPYQGAAAGGVAATGAIRKLVAGKGLAGAMGSVFGPAPMAVMLANPLGRAAQAAADRSYLGASKKTPYISARTADMAEGGLKDVNVKKVSRRLGFVSKRSSFVPDPHAVQRAVEKSLQGEANKRAATAAVLEAFPPDPAPTLQQMIDKAVEKDRVSRLVDEAVEAARPALPELSFSARARQALGKKLPGIAAGAAMLPLGIAAVVGLDRANRAVSSVFQRAAETGRFNRAMQGFDPSQMGDPSFQYRYEQDPQGMNRALRESFGVLNRIAPNVAKDPTLAREYMKRITLDPEYRQPPEEYLRQVQGAVQLENALQSAQPSLFEGLGTAPGMLMKGL